MNFKYSFLIFIISFLFYWSCANIGQPTGGPKDTLAPVLLITQPLNKSLNVQTKIVSLTFDEYIKVDNIKNQLIIIPSPKGEYKSKVIKNRIELEFEDPFEENTTYTFNFRDAIKDITEGNKTLDVKLAFSTGNYIDSLTIEGQVKNLFNNKEQEKVLVTLYKANDTLDIFNEKPIYFTYTDKEGNYIIENIKNGKYRLYAIKDKNNNLKADSEEEYGFSSDTINLQENISKDLKTMRVSNKLPKIQSKRANGKYYEVKFSKYILDYNFEIKDPRYDSTKVLQTNLVEENKTLRIYNNLDINIGDSLLTKINYTDTIGQTFSEEFFVKFSESKKKKEAFKVDWELKNSNSMNRPIKVKAKFNKPIKTFEYDSITIFYDSINYEVINENANLQWNKNKTELTIEKIIDKSKVTKNEEEKLVPLNFVSSKSSFISIESDTSESFTKEIKLRREEEYGVLRGKIDTEYKSFFIQLINNKNEIVAEIKNKTEYEFKTIEPGDYTIRIMIDENNNGIWDIGNINLNIEPERIYFVEEPISIRANWEIENKEIKF